MENKNIPEPSILIVDDEEVIRKFLIRELQMKHFTVTAAASGSEAVAALEEGQYDLVISALMMPGVDGVGVLKAARKNAPLTSVIILTSCGVMQSAIDALRHGADDVASKPCDIDELVSRIRHCLDKRNLLLEREQSMKALRESEERNRSILNALPAEIAVLDPDGVIIAVNDSWRRFALENGIAADKPVPNIEVGFNYLSVCKAVTGIESDDALRSYKGIQSVLDGRLTDFNLEYPCHAPEKEGWFSMDVTPISLDRKRGVVVVHSNVTKLKKAEEALRVSEEKYRTVADFTYAMETWRTLDGKYIYVSPSCERITGYTVAEFLVDSNLMVKISHPEDRSKVIEHYKVANRGTEAQNMGIDFRILTPNGDIRWIGHSCTPVHNGCGAQLGRRESNRDITNRKRTEREKEKLEVEKRLLQKAESLSRMAGGIAHHFNNKLHVVMGQLEMAKEGMARGETSSFNLTAAMLAADQAVAVSKMLLISLGQVTGKQEPLCLSEVCRNALSTLRASAPKGVKIETDLPSPGPAVKANAKQIQQILSYLVTNAWESADDAQQCIIHLSTGTVSLADIPTSRRFPVQWQPCRDSYACLEVRDNGCGITEEALEEIFSPFFSTKFAGRGLGLSMVLGLVQAHGGVVTIESSPGQGSVFRVFFPATAEGIVLQPYKETKASKIQETGTVLLVDDDRVVLEITGAMLSKLGFTVLTAMDGIEAVEVFQQHKEEICLVVTDVAMPRMNGWETLLALRQIMPDIPVILASGFSEEQVMEEAHPERPQAFLGKPYGFQVLKETIRQALRETKI